MKHLKLFEAYDREKNADKIELIDEIFPKVISMFKSLKDDATWTRSFMDKFTRGAWIGQIARSSGQEQLQKAINQASNNIDSLNYIIGPKPFGSFKLNFNKRTLLDRLLGRNKPMGYTPVDESVIGQIIGLVKNAELSKHLNDAQLHHFADELWDIHPNNPKNKERAKRYKEDKNVFIKDLMDDFENEHQKEMEGVEDYDAGKFNVGSDTKKETLDFKYAIEISQQKIDYFKSKVNAVISESKALLHGKIDDEAMKHFDDIVHFEIMGAIKQAEDVLKNPQSVKSKW
jgi:hypothetical protein